MTRRFDEFIRHGVYLRNWRPTTVRTYRQGLASLGVEVPTKADLDAWVIRLRERGLTPGGCNMYIRTVNSYLTWLHEEGHTPTRLRVKLLRAPLKVPTLLSFADIRTILAYRPTTLGEHRTKTLILLLLDTGLRIGEALRLERRRVDLDNLLFVVLGKGSKERPVPFSRDLRAALFRWIRRTPAATLLFETRTGLPLVARNAYRSISDPLPRFPLIASTASRA